MPPVFLLVFLASLQVFQHILAISYPELRLKGQNPYHEESEMQEIIKKIKVKFDSILKTGLFQVWPTSYLFSREQSFSRTSREKKAPRNSPRSLQFFKCEERITSNLALVTPSASLLRPSSNKLRNI